MEFNPENKVVQLCAKGMEQEGNGSFADFLPNDGYGNMIKAGITKGLERVAL